VSEEIISASKKTKIIMADITKIDKPEIQRSYSERMCLKPAIKAHKTEKNALTFTKVRLNKLGWRYVDFRSRKGYPRTGIVDLVAFKLDKKDHDKLKVILFQVKGGSARIEDEEKRRLEEAVKKVQIAFNWAEKPEKSVIFDWEPTDELFDVNEYVAG